MNCKHSFSFTHKDTETRAAMRTWHRHMLLITSSQNVTYITKTANNSITGWGPAVSFYIKVNAKPHHSGPTWVGILVRNSPRWLPRSRDLSLRMFRANVFSAISQKDFFGGWKLHSSGWDLTWIVKDMAAFTLCWYRNKKVFVLFFFWGVPGFPDILGCQGTVMIWKVCHLSFVLGKTGINHAPIPHVSLRSLRCTGYARCAARKDGWPKTTPTPVLSVTLLCKLLWGNWAFLTFPASHRWEMYPGHVVSLGVFE